MTDPANKDPAEPQRGGERPDLGRTEDRLKAALTGTPEGSFTRAGSPAGGSASGSERAPTQDAINDSLASEGTQPADASDDAPAADDVVNNTGADLGDGDGPPARGRDIDAASG